MSSRDRRLERRHYIPVLHPAFGSESRLLCGGPSPGSCQCLDQDAWKQPSHQLDDGKRSCRRITVPSAQVLYKRPSRPAPPPALPHRKGRTAAMLVRGGNIADARCCDVRSQRERAQTESGSSAGGRWLLGARSRPPEKVRLLGSAQVEFRSGGLSGSVCTGFCREAFLNTV